MENLKWRIHPQSPPTKIKFGGKNYLKNLELNFRISWRSQTFSFLRSSLTLNKSLFQLQIYIFFFSTLKIHLKNSLTTIKRLLLKYGNRKRILGTQSSSLPSVEGNYAWGNFAPDTILIQQSPGMNDQRQIIGLPD